MAWTDILGHDFAKRILQTHLSAGTVSSAYLLAGPEGIGKRKLALELAKALNCLTEQEVPCDLCSTCRQIARYAHPDVHTLAPGGASGQIRIEEIRTLIGRIVLRPFNARMQVAIIDGPERLTEEAANSVLKALEEPPAHTRFVLVSAQPAHCLPTITSRCQLIRCQPLSTEVIHQILVDIAGCEPAQAEQIARVSDGSASHALALARRWREHEALLGRLARGASDHWMDQPLPETRQDLIDTLDGIMRWLRDLAVAASADPRWIQYVSYANAISRQAQQVDVDRCLAMAFDVVELRESVEQFANPRLVASLVRERWLSLTTVSCGTCQGSAEN